MKHTILSLLTLIAIIASTASALAQRLIEAAGIQQPLADRVQLAVQTHFEIRSW